MRLGAWIVFGSLSAMLGGACRGGRAEVPVAFTREPHTHRAAAAVCEPHARASPDGRSRVDSAAECTADGDCSDKPHGFCRVEHVDKGTNRQRCSYDRCLTDAECRAGQACECQDTIPHACIDAGCRLDAECAAPHYCSFSIGHAVRSPDTYDPAADRGFFCHTSADLCIDDDDCLRPNRCSYDRERNRWACQPLFAPG